MKFNDVNIEQKVLERAAAMIFQKGVKGWNMDQLAEKAGLAKNTLYKMIGSKEDLIEKVLLGYIQSVQAEMMTIIANEKDYIQALENIITGFPERLNSIYADTMQEILTEFPAVEKKIRMHRDQMTQGMIGFLETGMTNGTFRNDIQPEMVFEMFQGILIHMIKSGYKGTDLVARLRLSFRCILEGIRN